jgi:hypothetical protein
LAVLRERSEVNTRYSSRLEARNIGKGMGRMCMMDAWTVVLLLWLLIVLRRVRERIAIRLRVIVGHSVQTRTTGALRVSDLTMALPSEH